MKLLLNIAKVLCVFIFLIFSSLSFGQTAFNLAKEKSSKIRFQLINNIIVMPLELNGVKLSFVLDSGVSRPILFNLVNMDSLQIKNTEQSYLRGLGSNGSIQAIRSRGNIIKVGEAVAVNRDVSLVFDESINFTSRLGVSVHGIIGYDIFKDFIVEVNYKSKYLRLYKREYFSKKRISKWKELDIEIVNLKPYLNGEVVVDNKLVPVKLLIDTGGSDALWLFENSNKNIVIPTESVFDDFLGKGLSGSVYGKRSKFNAFKLANLELHKVNVAYPDSASLSIARNFKERNGSVAGSILKRFNHFFDYENKKLYIKKNGNFNLPFYYNNSGITVEQNGFRVAKEKYTKSRRDSYGRKVDNTSGIDLFDTYKMVLKPSFTVVELRKNSNAMEAGIKIGDIILSVNAKETSNLSLQELNKFFYDKKGKLLRVRVDRGGKELSFRFQLDDVFKKKEPSKEGSN